MALAVACCLAAGARAGGKEPAPYDLAVHVAYGTKVGSESVREWAEREIVEELDKSGCFTAVASFDADRPGGADLLLNVIIQDFEDKTEYETTLAQRDDPNAIPTARLRYVAGLEVWGEVELRKLPESRPVRARNLHLTRGYRPIIGEDAEYEVRRLLIDALADEMRSWACKGARKKLPREIEQALTGGPAR